jgi:chromosome partitioning protein
MPDVPPVNEPGRDHPGIASMVRGTTIASGTQDDPATPAGIEGIEVGDGTREPGSVPESERTTMPGDRDPTVVSDPPSPTGAGGDQGTGPGSERAEPDPASEEPAATPSLPRVIAVANQKGGVGKTTTTVNLGAALAELDYRTLVIDLDPQGNATTGLGINYRTLDKNMYDVLLHDVPIEDCIEPTEVRNLFVAPASLDLAGAEIELVPAFSRESRLKRALAEVLDDYDYVLIDCPPSLGLLTVNGLVAATELMVPIQCEYYALEGLAQLTRNVELVRTNLNHDLRISAIVLVMYDSRTKLAEQVVTEVRNHFGSKVCRNMIPRNIRLSEAPSFGQPITTFDPSSRGAVAYRELAREVSGGS